MKKCFKQKTFMVCDNGLDFSEMFLITKDILFKITFVAAIYHSKLRVNNHTLRFAQEWYYSRVRDYFDTGPTIRFVDLFGTYGLQTQ